MGDERLDIVRRLPGVVLFLKASPLDLIFENRRFLLSLVLPRNIWCLLFAPSRPTFPPQRYYPVHLELSDSQYVASILWTFANSGFWVPVSSFTVSWVNSVAKWQGESSSWNFSSPPSQNFVQHLVFVAELAALPRHPCASRQDQVVGPTIGSNHRVLSCAYLPIQEEIRAKTKSQNEHRWIFMPPSDIKNFPQPSTWQACLSHCSRNLILKRTSY